MFVVQRAASDGNPTWKNLGTHKSEEQAREAFQKQLMLYHTGRFRIVGPAGEVLAEAKALPLFQRSARDEQERPPTLYVPEEPKRRAG